MAKRKSNTNTQLIIVGLIIVGIATAIYLAQTQTNFITDAFRKGQSYKAVSSAQDLDIYLNDINMTDIDALDAGIQENNSDASYF